MKGKFFLDTNIFIYSFDTTNRIKQKKAQQLIEDALKKNQGVISYQVIQEFLNVATKKFSQPFSHLEMHLYLEKVLMPLCDFFPDNQFYAFALDIKDYHKFSFYDSLIIAAALKMECKILYTEELQHGQKLAGLTIINPF